MNPRRSEDLRFGGLPSTGWRTALIVGVMLGAGFAALGLFGTTPCRAATIPAWLDDGIAEWSKAHPESPIQFVAIKDGYVWYRMTATPTLGSKDIRSSVYGIANKNGYASTQDEEMVTTGRPPVPNGPAKTVKCWTRSFLRDAQKGSTTTVERMLTTMVCEEGPTWSVGFRILE